MSLDGKLVEVGRFISFAEFERLDPNEKFEFDQSLKLRALDRERVFGGWNIIELKDAFVGKFIPPERPMENGGCIAGDTKLNLAPTIVECMNLLLEIDREAITALLNARVRCSEELASHSRVLRCGAPYFGLMGILNELCGEQSIHAELDGSGSVSRFICSDDTEKSEE